MAISDWSDVMPDTITHEAVLTRDEYGKPATFDTIVSYQARVTGANKRVPSRTPGGQDAIASVAVWSAKISGLKLDDRITLPDGTTPPILSYDHVGDEKGDHHTKILFGAV